MANIVQEGPGQFMQPVVIMLGCNTLDQYGLEENDNIYRLSRSAALGFNEISVLKSNMASLHHFTVGL